MRKLHQEWILSTLQYSENSIWPGDDFLNEEAQYDIPVCYELPSRAERQVADPYVFGPPGSGSVSQRYGSGSFHHQAKIVRKALISTVL
jgi:hypothetical protein